eukprot:3515601-Pyramimonas_sp.AAC.1
MVFVRGTEWDMIRLLDVGVAWVTPRRQVPPLFFSYRDQRTVVCDELCGYCVKIVESRPSPCGGSAYEAYLALSSCVGASA